MALTSMVAEVAELARLLRNPAGAAPAPDAPPTAAPTHKRVGDHTSSPDSLRTALATLAAHRRRLMVDGGRFRFVSACTLPTRQGPFHMRVYVNALGVEVSALVGGALVDRLAARVAEDGADRPATRPTPRPAPSPAPVRAAEEAIPGSLAPPEDMIVATPHLESAGVPVRSSRSRLPLVRVHDACATSEIFGSTKCDCRDQLWESLRRIRDDPAGGVVIYLPQEGRGIGLASKVAAYALQERGWDTVDANRELGLPDDARDYAAVRDVLVDDLGLDAFRLLTNNPRKVRELQALGLAVAERVPIALAPASAHAAEYLRTKKERMGHWLDGHDDGDDDGDGGGGGANGGGGEVAAKEREEEVEEEEEKRDGGALD